MTTDTRYVLVGELRCLQCARTAATAKQQPDGLHVKPKVLEHAESVRRMRCPTCGGNLQIVDTEIEAIFRRRFTPDELLPKRGRPFKSLPAGVVG